MICGTFSQCRVCSHLALRMTNAHLGLFCRLLGPYMACISYSTASISDRTVSLSSFSATGLINLFPANLKEIFFAIEYCGYMNALNMIPSDDHTMLVRRKYSYWTYCMRIY